MAKQKTTNEIYLERYIDEEQETISKFVVMTLEIMRIIRFIIAGLN